MRLGIVLVCSIVALGQSTAPTPEPKTQPSTSSPDHPNKDFGLGLGSRGRQMGQLDILSDTQGVDFRPYLMRILSSVRQNWYVLIPESVATNKGKLAIEFAITSDGQVTDMRLVASSGEAALDRPAWGSITNSNPFPPLPSDFKGRYVALRLRYYYNPDKSDLTGSSSTSELPTVHESRPVPGRASVQVNIMPPTDVHVPVRESRTFTAMVTGTTRKAIKWSITGKGCSGSACGKMSKGRYRAPSVLPSPPFVTLTAISKADPTAKASITIRIVQPPSP